MLLRQTTGGELKFNPTTLRGSLIEAIEILKQYLPVGFVPDGRMIINDVRQAIKAANRKVHAPAS